MGEQIKKKFLLYFRLMLLIWIVIANALLHVINFQYSWLIFISKEPSTTGLYLLNWVAL